MVAAASFAAGACFASGQAPIGAVAAALIGGALQLMVVLQAQTPRGAAWSGWMFGTGYFALSLHWIVEPFLVDVAQHGWMAPFALVFLSTGLALFWAFAHGLAKWMSRGAVSLAIAWVLFLSVVELARAYVFTGFPWGLPAYIWVDHGLAQSVASIGPYGLTLLTFALCAAICGAVTQAKQGRLLWSVPVALISGLALWMPPPLPQAPDPSAPIIRIVQPNAPQSEKWQADKVQMFFDRGLALTARDGDVDLIVWPETSVPVWLDNAAGAFGAIANRAGGAPVVLGVQRREDRRFFNSAVMIEQAQVTALYDKSHLVPFGEYIPFGDVFSALGIQGLAAREGHGYSAGAGPSLMDIPGIGTAQPLVCYEGIFPHLVGATSERARLLLLITNDGWFGNWAGPRQHLVQAQFRAIEQGTPMVRSANTGISAMIDARGRITGSLPLNTQGALDQPLPTQRPPTFYAQAGDLPFAIFLAFLVALLGVAPRAMRAFEHR